MTFRQKALRRFYRDRARGDNIRTNTYNSPSRLDRLPPELLYLICSYLSTSDLFHLVQTNRQLRHHGECMLFTHIQLPSTITQSGLNRLINTLKTQPTLSQAVESFRFEFGIIEINGERDDYPPGKWRRQYDKWKIRLKLMEQPVKLAEIFPLVPNIRRLRVHVSVLESRLFREFSKQKPCSLCRSQMTGCGGGGSGGSLKCKLALPFHQLEVLEVDQQEFRDFIYARGYMVVEALGKFVTLPSLREYSGVVPDCPDGWPGPYSLEKLTIMTGDVSPGRIYEDFRIEETMLCELLPRCGRLRRIEFTRHAGVARGFAWAGLHEVLLKVKDRLRELVIVEQQHFPMLSLDYDSGLMNGTWFGSLSLFEQLESVEMPWIFLTERNTAVKDRFPGYRMENILPRSLRTLVINDYMGLLGRIDLHKHEHHHRPNAWLETCISNQRQLFVEYVMRWREYTPKLEGIEVRLDKRYGTVDVSHIEFMRKMCRMVNLEFVP